MLPSERHDPDLRPVPAGGHQRVAPRLATQTSRWLPAWSGRLTPHVLRHYCASSLYGAGMDLKALQELLGHQWLATTSGYIHVRSDHIEQAWVNANRRWNPVSQKEDERMLWNMRLKAAERGIWKSAEMRRRLADAGLELSAGKMSALWAGTPTTIRLDDLDVICAVLECDPAALLIREPEKVAACGLSVSRLRRTEGTSPRVPPRFGKPKSEPPSVTAPAGAL
jgi:putative transcriptional regulator